MLSCAAIENAILTAHAAHFSSDALPAQPTPDAPSDANPIYVGALAAASQMGFIAADAQCLARAWQCQSERMGQFNPQLWPCELQDFEKSANPPKNPEETKGHFRPRLPFASTDGELGLYAVLPDAAWVERMAVAGVKTLQLRLKSNERADIIRQIRQSVAAAQSHGARLFINDHWQEAIDAQAYGVHLGQEDLDALPAAALEHITQAGLRLGISTHGYAEIIRAHYVRPSYIALGAIFPTTLKKMATAPQGISRLYAYARLLKGHYPLVAIGGIAREQFPEILKSGVGSIAVVRAIVNAQNPETAAQELIHAMQST